MFLTIVKTLANLDFILPIRLMQDTIDRYLIITYKNPINRIYA